ncbi:MAG: hypothetical protein KDD36_08170 [Flavobacteriales bacterium]|nr:hypothetical protein [Flavobacteriales bacterium]
MTKFKIPAFIFITVSICFASCSKCVECSNCQGNNNSQGEEVCQKDFSDKDSYNAYVEGLETVGGCSCK